MPCNSYLKLVAQHQGAISGSVTQKLHQGTIAVAAVQHAIISPRDAASGLPTGKREHHPLVITKELDRATPHLYSALVNNENIPTCELQFWEFTPQGRERMTYTIKLTNANIASIDFRMDGNQPSLPPCARYEVVSFTYQKIEWTWADGNISAQDDWEAPVV